MGLQDAQTAVDMARGVKVAGVFAELCIRQRRGNFAQDVEVPRGTWKASETERRRVAQAFLRFWVVTGLYKPAFHNAGMDGYFTGRLSTLFGRWELEQIATVADFLGLNVKRLLEATSAYPGG